MPKKKKRKKKPSIPPKIRHLPELIKGKDKNMQKLLHY